MKKLRLQVEELAVESFETQEVEVARGTVKARASDNWECTGAELSCDYGCTTGNENTCPTAKDTCYVWASCNQSGCGTCNPGCGPETPVWPCPE